MVSGSSSACMSVLETSGPNCIPRAGSALVSEPNVMYPRMTWAPVNGFLKVWGPELLLESPRRFLLASQEWVHFTACASQQTCAKRMVVERGRDVIRFPFVGAISLTNVTSRWTLTLWVARGCEALCTFSSFSDVSWVAVGGCCASWVDASIVQGRAPTLRCVLVVCLCVLQLF